MLSSRAFSRPWYDGPRSMLKGFTHARLACGCRIAFREGVEGSPVTVIVDEKSPACALSLHVRDLDFGRPAFRHIGARRRIDGHSGEGQHDERGPGHPPAPRCVVPVDAQPGEIAGGRV